MTSVHEKVHDAFRDDASECGTAIGLCNTCIMMSTEVATHDQWSRLMESSGVHAEYMAMQAATHGAITSVMYQHSRPAFG
eukprot:4205058-Prymnesium_polylepis.2